MPRKELESHAGAEGQALVGFYSGGFSRGLGPSFFLFIFVQVRGLSVTVTFLLHPLLD